MEILTPSLFVFGTAIVLGVLLLVISHFFRVEKNPLEVKVRECLPGINCGACGYKGCDDYAAALAEGSAKPNLCVPGAQKVSDEISDILGIEKVVVEDKVAFIACNGHREATHQVAIYEGVSTCRAASMMYGGPNACRYGCLGLGDCAAVCPSGAICLADGIAHVDLARCVGCALCAKTCPKQVIQMLPVEATVAVSCHNRQKGADARKACKNACIACRKCEKACTSGAITVTDNLAVIDYSKCTHCGACVKECPTGCLHATDFSPATVDFDFDTVEK